MIIALSVGIGDNNSVPPAGTYLMEKGTDCWYLSLVTHLLLRIDGTLVRSL